jgi:hypothetical protein
MGRPRHTGRLRHQPASAAARRGRRVRLDHATIDVESLTSLSGRVVDVETFEPFAGATVRVEPGDHETTATGDFSFPADELPPGDYTATASYGTCNGEQPVTLSGWVDGADLYLLPGSCGPAAGSQPVSPLR